MVRLHDILSMLADNTRRTGYPFSIPREAVYSWAQALGLPRGGEVVIYTSALYQLAPYINPLVKQLELLEGRAGAGVALRLARAVTKVVDVTKLAARPEKKDVELSEAILKSIGRLIKRSGVEAGSLYEGDLYSGALLYDLGLDDVLAEQLKRVYEELKRAGARKVITIDPHTTHLLRKVVPEYIEGFDIEVINYLELLAEKLERGELKPVKKLDIEVVVHDPCLYARYEGIIEQPRKLLEAAGVKVVEPKRARELTYCCGGPVESISPTLAKKIAATRLEELKSCGSRIVTMCPICLINLARAAGEGVEIKDISLYLAEAYLG